MSKVDIIYFCKNNLNKSINQRLKIVNEYVDLFNDTGDDRFIQSSDSICKQIDEIRKIDKKLDELLLYIEELGGDISQSDLS